MPFSDNRNFLLAWDQHEPKTQADQMTDQLPTTTTSNTALATPGTQDPFAALALVLLRPDVQGDIIKFIRGHWSTGKDGERGMDGARLVARMDKLMSGWRKWVNRQVVDARLGMVADGYEPPRRSDLGDTDENLWPVDDDGVPTDCWQFSFFLQFVDPSDSSIKYIWVAATHGAQKEIGAMSQAYADKRKHSPNALPLVELSSDFYRHRKYGRVDTPQLDIIGWVGEETPVPQAQVSSQANPNSDIDDEIPF
jgi:hypothetical protein